jgi:hypothetical protein
MNRETLPRQAADTNDRARAGAPQDRTPSTDMQAEDAGTPASGNSGRGTAAAPAMKQTSKTADEGGANR